jgi:chitodextrinase
VHTIALTWSASTDNVGVTGYKVFRGGSLITTTTSTSYTDTGLKPNTSYSYYLRAIDAAGNQSANSTTATAKTADTTPPSAPSGLAAGELDVHRITLTWGGSTDDAGVTGYKLYRNGKYLRTVTTTSYTDGGLTPNTAYSYYVTARDAVGNESAASNTATASTTDSTPPTAPVLSGKISNTTDAYLTWTAASDNDKVTAYRLYRNGNLLATISPGTRSYTDKAVPSGTHKYTVSAVDPAGNSATSNTVTITF